MISQDGWSRADLVEIAVGLDGEGRILGVVPLSAAAHARVFAPDLALADSLAGCTLAAADQLLARHARTTSLAQPAWRSLRQALQRVADATR